MTIRVGIVGTGYGQAVLVPAFRQDPRFEVVALAASRPGKAREVAEKLGVPGAHDGWEPLLADPALDAVAVAVPPSLQPEIACAAAQKGKHLLLEKPLAVDLAGALRVRDAIRETGVASVVDFEFAALPAFRRLRELVLAEGGARRIDATWHVRTYANEKRLESWKTDPGQGGGALLSFASHSVHYLEWLAGPATRIRAVLGKAEDDERSGETRAVLDLDFATKASARLDLDTDSDHGPLHALDVQTLSSLYHLRNPGRDYIHGFGLERTATDGPTRPIGDISLTGHEDGRIAATAILASALADRIEGWPTEAPDVAAAVRAQLLLDAARRSHEAGDWISLEKK